jgi:uncharacterized protein with beta-barrel porin domain
MLIVVGFVGQANAADGDAATSELTASAVTANTVAGLLESNLDGAQTTVIDPNGGVTLGATGGADAITTTSTGAAAITLTVTDSSSDGDTLSLLGDVTLEDADSDDTLQITSTNAALLFGGDIVAAVGNSVTITGGDGSTKTINLTFNTADTDDDVQNINATINAGSAADTVNLIVTNTEGGANVTTFEKAIGGTTAATRLDAITLNAASDDPVAAVFNGAVNATTLTVVANTTAANETASGTFNGTLTLATSATITAVNNAAATLTLTGTGTNALTAVTLNDDTGLASMIINSTNGVMTVSGTINAVGATDEGTLTIKDDDAGAAGDLVTISDAVGGSNNLLALNVGSATEAGNVQFQGAVSAATITILGGNAAAETGLAEFQDAITATAIVLQDATGVTTLTVNATNGTKTVAGTINGGADNEGTLAVIDDDADAAPDAITFSGRVGGTNDVGTIAVGNSTQGGSAIFTSANAVEAQTLTITGGDNALEDSSVELQDALVATTVTLNDNTGATTLTINTTNGAQTIAGAISGGSAGEGTLTITDDDAGESDLATFSGAVGGTSLGTINIGSSTLGGDANFGSTSAATTVNITGGDAGSENAGGVFVGLSTFSNLNLTGGSDGTSDDATAEFQATGTNALGTVTLDDGTASDAIVSVNTTNGDTTVTGTVDGAASGEGTLLVFDDDNAGAADTATFSGNVGATNSLKAVTIGTANSVAGDAAFQGTLSATTITLNGGNDDAEDSAVTVTGNVTATTLNVLATTANNTATSIFTASADVTATNINVTGGTTNSGADATLNVAGDITATTITLDDNTGEPAQVVLNGGAAQTITGIFEGQGAGDGRINVTNTAGLVTFKSTIGATNTIEDIVVAANVSASFESTVAISDDLAIAAGTGTVTVDAAVTVGDDFTIGDGVTIAVDSSLGAGSTVFATTSNATAINDNDANAGVTITMPSNFQSGTMTFVNDDADQSTQSDEFAVTDTALVDYTFQSNAGDNTILEIVAVRKSASAAAAELGVSTAAASAFQEAGLAATSDAVLSQQLTDALTAGGSTASDAAETLQNSPGTMTAAGGQAVAATGGQVISVGSTRLASLRNGSQFASSQASGFAAGEGVLSKALWIKPFINFGDQAQRSGIAGYETDTYGTAFGADVKIGKSNVGLSFSYAQTDIDGKDAGRSQTDIDSFQTTMYADYTTKNWYLEGLIGYARNEINGTRTITANNGTADSDYGSNQYMFNIGGGMPIEVAQNHFITPNAAFQYTLVDNETYTETGAGLLNLRVDQDKVHIALGRFGARYHTSQAMESGTFTPEIRTALLYDFAGDEGQSTSVFNGGGAAFSVQGADIVQLGYTAGLGLSYSPTSDQGLTVSANYDWNQKTDFVGHSANFALRYEF